MTRIPIIAGSYQGQSIRANVQDAVNLYWEVDAKQGRQAMVNLPGLLAKTYVPAPLPTLGDDYSNLLAFRDPYEAPSGVTFSLTSDIAEATTGSQTFAGTLKGMSSTNGEELYWDDFRINFYTFTDQFLLEGGVDVTSSAASGTQNWTDTVTFSKGTKTARLEKPGSSVSVGSVDASAGTITLTGTDETANFYRGLSLIMTGDSGLSGDTHFSVHRSVLSGSDTVIYVDESLSGANGDGSVYPVRVYGTVYRNRDCVRSVDAPRGLDDVSSGSIEAEHKYQVFGDSYVVTYNGITYGPGESAGDVFIGVSGTTDYTTTGSGVVLDKTKQDLYELLGHKTLVKDQALAVVAACDKGESSNADNLLESLFEMRYPLASAGDHSGDTDNFAHVYYTLGFDDSTGNNKWMAPYPLFRAQSSFWAALGMLYYLETYPSGTHATNATTYVQNLLDHMADNFLITTSGHKQRWCFRAGKGLHDFRESEWTFDKDYLLKWALVEDQCLAWWAYHMADEQSLSTSSTVLSSESLDYGGLANNIRDKLYAKEDNDGFWMPLKERPAHAIAGVDVLELDKGNSQIRVLGDLRQPLAVDATLQVQGNSISANDGTYTVTAVELDATAITSGNIVAGTYYRVLGDITYNGVSYVGSVLNPVILQGVSGVTSYTGTPDSITPYETILTVSETIDTTVVYTAAGDGSAMFHDHRAWINDLTLYMLFLAEYGQTTRANTVSTFVEKFYVEEDENNDDLSGYRPALLLIRENTPTAQTGIETFGTSGETVPWSEIGFPSSDDSISYEHSFLAMLARASINDYAKYKRDMRGLTADRTQADGGFPYTNTVLTDFGFRRMEWVGYVPLMDYELQTYAGSAATAWGVILQRLNGFLGVSNDALSIAGRSSENGVRGFHRLGGKLYAVVGNLALEIDTDYSYSVICDEPLFSETGAVTMASVDDQLMICEGSDSVAYHYNATSGTWTRMTSDNNFNGGGSIAAIDRVFLSHKPSTRTVQFSPVGGGTTWDLNDDFKAEANSDNIVRVFADKDEVWVFKEQSIEVFYNAGASDFTRYSGGKVDIGCSAPHSVVQLDNSIYWLDESYLLRHARGFNGLINVPQIAAQFEKFSDQANAVGFGYTQGGRKFYQLSFPDDDKTYIYEISGDNWTRRESFIENTELYGRHRGNVHALFNQVNLVGDFENGTIYALDPDTYDDDGYPRICQLTPQVIIDSQNHNRVFVHRLELEFEPGVGLNTGQGEDPQAMMAISKDHGVSWGNPRWRTIGKIGEYRRRVFWARCGASRNFAFKVSVSDPVKVVIVDGYVSAEAGAG